MAILPVLANVTENRSQRTSSSTGYFVTATLLIKVGSNLTFWFKSLIERPKLCMRQQIVCLFADVQHVLWWNLPLIVFGGTCCCCSKLKGNFLGPVPWPGGKVLKYYCSYAHVDLNGFWISLSIDGCLLKRCFISFLMHHRRVLVRKRYVLIQHRNIARFYSASRLSQFQIWVICVNHVSLC